jgi:hypothetical protein
MNKIISSDFEMKIVEDIINQFKPRDAKVNLDTKATKGPSGKLDDVDDAFLDRDFYQIFQNITNTTGLNEWQKLGFINNNRTTKQLNEVREYEMNISL